MLLVHIEFEVFGNHFLVLSPRKVFIAKKITCHVSHACNHGDYNDEGSISLPATDVMLLYASIGTSL